MRTPPFWLFVLPCAGWTQCAYFSNVPIPNTDGIPPAIHGVVYNANNTIIATSLEGSAPFSVTYPSAGTTLFPVVSTIDAGGAAELEVSVEITRHCCASPGCTTYASTSSIGYSFSEVQNPTATVSTGIWLDHSVGTPCGGQTPYTRSYLVTYSAVAYDFRGNRHERMVGNIHYP